MHTQAVGVCHACTAGPGRCWSVLPVLCGFEGPVSIAHIGQNGCVRWLADPTSAGRVGNGLREFVVPVLVGLAVGGGVHLSFITS